MDDKKVTPGVQELHSNNYLDLQSLISVDRHDNDGIEEDADYDDPDHGDWYE